MKIEGRLLSAEMVQKVKNPFSENSGKKLSLKDIARYIKTGDEALEKDKKTLKAINEGMKSLEK